MVDPIEIFVLFTILNTAFASIDKWIYGKYSDRHTTYKISFYLALPGHLIIWAFDLNGKKLAKDLEEMVGGGNE